MSKYLIVGAGLFGAVFAHEARPHCWQRLHRGNRWHSSASIWRSHFPNL